MKVTKQPSLGTLKILIEIIKVKGISAVMKSSKQHILNYAPMQALNFGFYHLFFSGFKPQIHSMSSYLTYSIVSGGLAGALSLAFLFPEGIIKTKIINDPNRLINYGKKRAVDYVLEIIKTQGIESLYKGYPFSALGSFAFRALYFGYSSA